MPACWRQWAALCAAVFVGLACAATPAAGATKHQPRRRHVVCGTRSRAHRGPSRRIVCVRRRQTRQHVTLLWHTPSARAHAVAVHKPTGQPGGAPTPPGGVPVGEPAPAPCTIFVSPTGGGSGASADSPEAFSDALSRVVPGSVVCLEAGTYSETSNVWISRSGTPSAPITYRNYGGEALIQYTGGTSGAAYLSGGLLETSSGSDWGGTHDIVFDGLTLDGANLIGSGIALIQGGHHLTIRDCVISNTGETGIALNAVDYVTVEHNMIHHTGYNQGWSSGISLWYGGPNPTYGGSTAWYDTYAGFHNVIVDNIVSGAYDNSSNHTDGNGIIVDGSGSIPPVLIANNLVYENGGRGIEVYDNDGSAWVVNNTAYADGLDLKVSGGRAPDYGAYQASDVHFINNLAYGRQNGQRYTSAYTYNNTSSNISWAGDMGYNGSAQGVSSSVISSPTQYRYGAPMFASLPPISSDSSPWALAPPPRSIGNAFTLRSNSPAIGGGTNPTTGMSGAEVASAQPYLSTDLAGDPRGSTPSPGAYEG